MASPGEDVEEDEPIHTAGGEQKNNMTRPFHSGLYLKGSKVEYYRRTCTAVFTAALFTTATKGGTSTDVYQQMNE